MKIQVIYDNNQIVSVTEFVGGTTYTALNVVVDDVEGVTQMLAAKGLDCTLIEDFVAEHEQSL